MTLLNAANATMQLGVDPVMRGRVMALYMAVLMGGTPIGAPLVGAVAEAFGARWSLIVGGLISATAAIVAGALLARREGMVHPGRAAPDRGLPAARPAPRRGPRDGQPGLTRTGLAAVGPGRQDDGMTETGTTYGGLTPDDFLRHLRADTDRILDVTAPATTSTSPCRCARAGPCATRSSTPARCSATRSPP